MRGDQPRLGEVAAREEREHRRARPSRHAPARIRTARRMPSAALPAPHRACHGRGDRSGRMASRPEPPGAMRPTRRRPGSRRRSGARLTVAPPPRAVSTSPPAGTVSSIAGSGCAGPAAPGGTHAAAARRDLPADDGVDGRRGARRSRAGSAGVRPTPWIRVELVVGRAAGALRRARELVSARRRRAEVALASRSTRRRGRRRAGSRAIRPLGWSGRTTGRAISSAASPVRVRSALVAQEARAALRMSPTLATAISAARRPTTSHARREIATPREQLDGERDDEDRADVHVAARLGGADAGALERGQEPERGEDREQREHARRHRPDPPQPPQEQRGGQRPRAAGPSARVTGSSPISGPASPASALSVAAAESATKPGASVSSRRTDPVSW